MKYFSRIKYLWVLALVAIVATSCYNDKSKRHIEFSPNMYNSIPLEPYSQTVWDDGDSGMVKLFTDGLSSQKPPANTVPRGESWYRGEDYQPYHYSNTPEGYDSAGLTLMSPISDPELNEKGYNCTEASFLRGKEVYDKFCIMCHGPNGKGQGSLVTKGALGGIPSYSDDAHKDLSAGTMYHSITYGKGLMGSYASQITPKQRWEVICYIQKFQEQAE